MSIPWGNVPCTNTNKQERAEAFSFQFDDIIINKTSSVALSLKKLEAIRIRKQIKNQAVPISCPRRRLIWIKSGWLLGKFKQDQKISNHDESNSHDTLRVGDYQPVDQRSPGRQPGTKSEVKMSVFHVALCLVSNSYGVNRTTYRSSSAAVHVFVKHACDH